MDDTEIIVEDGEITDDSDDNGIDDIETYKVLERPSEILKSVQGYRSQPVDNVSDGEIEEESSDSDSDTGYPNRPKRTKLKKLPLPKSQPKIKKYDIWSRRAQEDALTETLVTCDVSKVDRSLGVESYDYTRSDRYKDQCRKRKHNDKKNVHLRLGKRDDSSDKKGETRVILDLIENNDSNNEILAKDIANKLMEEKDDLILQIVKSVGKEKSIELFKKTQEIESDGGMLIMNGTRRRTPGGVYIFLLKRDDHITMEQQNEIFFDERHITKKHKRMKEKEKIRKHKAKIAKNEEKLKELPSRIELTMKEKELTIIESVPNPPPSPASEDSNALQNTSDRSVNNYYDDFLDVGIGIDMDMF